MPRQKTVFDNAQLCHVWAQQTQPTGRSGSMFFEGNKIYSYGTHYLAGIILKNKKGKQFAVLNSNSYSVTTSKHMGLVCSAVYGLMPYFYSPSPNDLNCTLNHSEVRIQFKIDAYLKMKKVTSKEEIRNAFATIHARQKEYNELRAILGKKPKFISTKKLDEIETHLKARLKRYQELNTPDQIAKREKIKQAKTLKKQSESIAKFRAGENVLIRGLPYELLRVKGDEVQTSRGASVPLSQAIQLFKCIKSGKGEGLLLAGTQIGHFRLTDIYTQGAETVVTIGCHKILMSEAEKVLSEFLKPKLTLVENL